VTVGSRVNDRMACQLDGFMHPPTRGRGGFFPDPLWANPAQA
jgi:hypothetical protein